MGANQPNPMFGQAGAGLPPEIMQAFAGIASQLQQKQQQINAPKQHPILEAIGQTLLMGPAGAIGMNIGTKQRNQNLTRQAELDALQALQSLAYSVNQTNNTRNDAGFNQLVSPLFAQAGLTNLPAQSDPKNTLELLYSINAPEALRVGAEQIGEGANQGVSGGLNLANMFNSAPKPRAFPKREDVVTMNPDGGKVANQGGEKYEAPQAPQGDGYEYVPMGQGMENSPGIKEVPTQAPLVVETGASKALPIPIDPATVRTIIEARQRGMSSAFGEVPNYAKLPSQIEAEKALAQQRQAAAALDVLRKALMPAESAAQIRQSDASATNSLASAYQTSTETDQLKAMHPLNVQLKQLEMNKALTAGQMAQLKPYRLQADIAFKALEEQGLVNPDTKEVKLPKGFLGGDKSTPAQRSAYLNHQQATQQLREEIAKLTGSGQPQAQQGKQQAQPTGDVFLDWKNKR